jgi:hypothetical protein
MTGNDILIQINCISYFWGISKFSLMNAFKNSNLEDYIAEMFEIGCANSP